MGGESLLRILGSFDRDVTEKAERRILRDSRVLVEGERSVEPPTNHGCFLAIAFSTLPEESLLAIPFASGGNVGISESQLCGGSGVESREFQLPAPDAAIVRIVGIEGDRATLYERALCVSVAD